MALKLNSRIKISKDVLFRELEGEAVMLNPQNGVYFGLNQMGTILWALMQKQSRLSDILKSMTEQYEIDSKICQEDLFRFVSHLEKNQLIEVHED